MANDAVRDVKDALRNSFSSLKSQFAADVKNLGDSTVHSVVDQFLSTPTGQKVEQLGAQSAIGEWLKSPVFWAAIVIIWLVL